jgi:hypothetical protein
VGDLTGLPPLREAEICESTGNKNAQPTHPERNAQVADLCLPSKDDPKEMDYRHDEAQDAYLDGELCGVLPDGRTAFNLIQNAADSSQGSLVFFFVRPAVPRWRGHPRPPAGGPQV